MPTNKQEAIAAVAIFTSKVRALIMGSEDGVKITGLADKAREAELFLTHKALDPNEYILAALTLEAEERGRGETPKQLAEMIITKATKFRQIRAKVDGLEDRFKTAIQMAPNDALAVQTFHGAKAIAVQELAKLGLPEAVLNGL